MILIATVNVYKNIRGVGKVKVITAGNEYVQQNDCNEKIWRYVINDIGESSLYGVRKIFKSIPSHTLKWHKIK
jgi:hypothetical protein